MYILNKNLKSKFIILTLCFTLIFSSLNYNKSYADGGVISVPMLATVVTSALATGIVLKNSEDIYNMGRLFYDYVHSHNTLVWDTVVSTFQSSVAFNSLTNQLTLGREFKDILSRFFGDTFSPYDEKISPVNVGLYKGYPDCSSLWEGDIATNGQHYMIPYRINIKDVSVGDSVFAPNGLYYVTKTALNSYTIYNSEGTQVYHRAGVTSAKEYTEVVIYYKSGYFYVSSERISTSNSITNPGTKIDAGRLLMGATATVPYNPGSYDDSVLQSDETDKIFIPNDLSDILNGNPSDVVGDKAPGWVGNGQVSLPNVDNPSIGVVDGSFPQVDTDVGNPSIPGTDTDINTGIWATIKDFVISLVVPSDTFWTDTWNDLYGGFVSAFPGVDMDNFNSLVTGEKKFPNIDINIMGVKGRVVNGDVINSIVDWLRPIIAGFMMLCLMFFNYRKIYKLIRNSEPFGGIAPGTSDFSTGISEYSDNYLNAKHIIGENLRVMTSKGGK